MKIAVAVSGGIDSLFALYSLKQEGYTVFALHGRFLEKEYSLELLEKYCKEWEIPFYIEDFREEFKEKIIKPFIFDHAQISTPNPCVLCNREIKFGLLYKKAIALGASHLATGHYVAKSDYDENLDKTVLLKKAADQYKDQSYFLALVSADVLQHVLFPLADKKKEDIRIVLEQAGIEIPIPKESQEICFVPNDKHTEFIKVEAEKYSIPLPQEGRVELIGSQEDQSLFAKRKHSHKGLWLYTEGQRKGLGIAWKEALYVIKKDKEKNTLFLGEKHYLKQFSCKAHQPNFFLPYERWKDEELFVRTRFRQKMIPAQVYYNKEENIIEVDFKEAQEPIAVGQILAIYNSQDCLLAGALLFA